MDATETALAEPIEHTELIAGIKTFWRSVEPPPGQTPVLYVHGVPDSADAWTPFLQRTGGVAIDLPGFGRSEKPEFFEYSLGGYNAFLQAFIGQMGWDRFSVVVHDWGGLALVSAQELHERVERMVIINAVPLLPGYRWHRIARGWRTPLLGEFMMGVTTKAVSKYLSKESRPSGEPWPQAMLDSVWSHFDHGTQRTILKLYRSAPPEVLEQAGERLGMIEAPTLVLWGKEDPYIPERFAQAYADALPNGRVNMLSDAGHWPWLDRPDTIDVATDFLLSSKTSS